MLNILIKNIINSNFKVSRETIVKTYLQPLEI